MKKNISIHLALVGLALSIVLPVNASGKQLFSNRSATVSAPVLSGSPIPIPPPPGFAILTASGSPIPIPPPPGFAILTASGSPIPIPPPPGRIA